MWQRSTLPPSSTDLSTTQQRVLASENVHVRPRIHDVEESFRLEGAFNLKLGGSESEHSTFRFRSAH